MHSLMSLLEEVEAEMKAIGRWSAADVPEDQRTTFEHWLQFGFLPQARRRIAAGDIPADSQVGIMAMRQYDHHAHVPEAEQLVRLLNAFDRLVRDRSGVGTSPSAPSTPHTNPA